MIWVGLRHCCRVPLRVFLALALLGADSLPLVKGLSLEGGLFEFVEACLSLASSCSMRSLSVWISPCKACTYPNISHGVFKMTSFVREVRAETGVPMSQPCA